jgi:putative ABC transport system ATP-binding protein
MIQLTDIERYYRHGLRKAWVLNRISLNIEAGEFVTIMGPSGAGKSTLLNILGMLEAPSGGSYKFMGEPVHKLNEKKTQRISQSLYGVCFSGLSPH